MPSTEAGEPRPSPPDGFSTIILPVPTSHVQSQLPQTTEPGGTLPPPLLPASTSQTQSQPPPRQTSRISGRPLRPSLRRVESRYETEEREALRASKRRNNASRGRAKASRGGSRAVWSGQPRRRPSLSSGSLMKLSRTLRDEASRLICALLTVLELEMYECSCLSDLTY